MPTEYKSKANNEKCPLKSELSVYQKDLSNQEIGQRGITLSLNHTQDNFPHKMASILTISRSTKSLEYKEEDNFVICCTYMKALD